MIDQEVALKACQQVLLNVRLQDRGQSPGPAPTPGHALGSTSGPAPGTIREEKKEEEGLTPEDSAQQRQQFQTSPTQASPTQAPPLQAPPSARQSWLLRLFESRLFDVSMAVSYLYKSKDPGVQAYIGNRLFSFANAQVDFYLPQLLNMYVHMDEEVGDAIRPYLVSPPPAAALLLADHWPPEWQVFTVFCSEVKVQTCLKIYSGIL